MDNRSVAHAILGFPIRSEQLMVIMDALFSGSLEAVVS